MRHDCIPGYRIDRLIGKGGMAAVYLAIQESLDRPVALKVLRDPDSPEFSERFVNEGRIIANLVHGNIITVHDVGIAEGLHYISMEYVEGGDLKARIADGQSPETALDLTARMADCLGFAHRKGVIHRDLKPANILFRRDGTPLLTDFGIAKNQRLDSDLTVTGKIVGTPRYMSPEQGLGKAVDGRSDLYSLGVVLYEMLTGEPPYLGDSEVDTILRHLNDPVPALPAACRRYQPLLDRMLAKDPAARFADAGELIESLAALEGSGRLVSLGQTWSPRRPGPVSIPHASVEGSIAAPRSSRSIRRPWALSAVGIAAALVLGIGALRDEGPESRSAEQLPAVAPDAVPAVAGDTRRAPPASAELPDTDRLFRLGHAYRHGTGVPVDDRKAVELFSAAAERGHAAAQYYLGLMYAEGRGVPEELELAVHWFEQAARQNLVEGQFYLCLSYALGRGVSRDRVTAYAWCRTAEKRGSQDAKESLVEISKLMRRREIKQAEELAASIAESLGARPRVLLDTPSSARGEDHADSAS
ncbi:MAG: serine/threonine-protein kinase [Gammaproteobacteria bacterium]